MGALAVLVVLAIAGFAFVSANSDDSGDNATTTTQETEEKDASETQSDDDALNQDNGDMTDSENESNADNMNESDAGELDDNSAITAAVVATHSSADDCWTIVSGKVYNITEYIPRHPGGDTILQACGTDGTTLFTERTTEDGQTVGSGTVHSGGAASQLEGFLLGDLGQ